MKKGTVRTFRSRLRADLKDPEIKAHYKEELQAAQTEYGVSKTCSPDSFKGTFRDTR